ncbi:ATP-binding protein [Vibrio sonorensis]|uniref:ATP-binding protein n=1 Tax=Vibrio sonorensis TaxID=1004316 RepID=UPI0008D90553|nr:ATP-binding protein [Vibrio sonorensis]
MALTLTLIRGLPGSGKSTLAKTLGINHFEADMYFTNSKGEYLFNPEYLQAAHKWCQTQASKSLKSNQSCVVANTFVKHWEIAPYQKMAAKYGATFIVIECHQNYGNVHQVSEETIDNMRKRWQPWPNAHQR